MKTNIQIQCIDQVLTITNEPIVASGGVNEDTVTFEFCPMWNGLEKIATFYTDKEPEKVYERPLQNDSCVIPHEVLTCEGILNIGVLGMDGTALIRTSENIKYRIVKGAKRGQSAEEPTPDAYQELLTRARNAESVAQSVRNDANSGKFDGRDGVDGVSVTHRWEGTILHVTSASGTSSADLGAGGGDYGDIVIESEGCTDIFPDQSYHHLDHRPATSLGGVTDSPIYNLIGYNRGNELYEGRQAEYQNGFAADALEGTSEDYDITGYIPLTVGQTIRVKGMTFGGDYGGIALYSSQNENRGFVYFNDLVGNGRTNDSGAGTHDYGARVDADGVFTFTMSDTKKNLSNGATESTGFSGYGFDHVRLCCLTMDESSWENVVMTINEPIVESEKILNPSIKISPESLPDESSDSCRILNKSAFASGVIENADGNAMKIVQTGNRSVRLEGGYLVIDGTPYKIGTLYSELSDRDRESDCVYLLRYDKNSGEVNWVIENAVRIEKNTMTGETKITVAGKNYDWTTNSGGVYDVPRNDDEYRDFVVGYLHVGAYTSSMSGITDLRADDNFCGFFRYKTYAPEPTDKCVLLNGALFTNGVIENEERTALKITKTASMKARCEGGIIMFNGVPHDVKAMSRTYATYDTDTLKVHYVRLYKNGNKPEWKAIEPFMHGEDDNGMFFLLKESLTGEVYQFPHETDDFIDIPIFFESIPAGTTEITQDMLRDLRQYENFCGFARLKSRISADGSTSRTTVVPKTEINFTETDGYLDLYWVDLTNIATYVPQIETSPTYIVTFNNVVYECVAWNTDAQGLLIGNGAMIQKTTIYDNYKSDVPFVIFIDGDGINVYCNDAGVANIKIEKVN